VALHGGHLPGRPASHGCVRLPNAFAAKLFGATRLGTEVLIAEPEGPPGGKA
jgi:lipoprotein-anchoring transpeptidase ErfK/SrfK